MKRHQFTPTLIILIFFILSGCGPSHYVRTETIPEFEPQRFQRIAIFPFGNDKINMGVAISEALTTEFVSMGFDVVERTQLNAAMQELKLDLAGVIGDNARKEVGKFLDIDGMLVGSVTGYLGGWIYTVDLRLVDVRTGEIIWSANYLNKDPMVLEKPRKTLEAIVGSLETVLLKKKPQLRKRVRIARNGHALRKKFKKIALLPMIGTNYYGEGEALNGALATELLGNGMKLVERQSLDMILKEQFRYAAGFYIREAEKPRLEEKKDEKKATATMDQPSISSLTPMGFPLSQADLDILGKMTGADGLLIGSFSPSFAFDRLFMVNIANLRLIDIETGRIAWSVTYYNGPSMGPLDDITESASWLAIAICPAIKTDNLKDQITELGLAAKRKAIAAYKLIDELGNMEPEPERQQRVVPEKGRTSQPW